MLQLLYTEWLKTKRTKIWLLLLAPLLPILYSLLIFTQIMMGQYQYEADNQWLMTWMLHVMFYGNLLFPILCGIMATTLCQLEHSTNSWKQLFSLPIPKIKLFWSKLGWLWILVGLTQLMALTQFIILGFVFGLDDPLPLLVLVKSIVLGWIGAFPLTIIQLLMAYYWNSFAKPMIVTVLLTFPSFLITSSEMREPFGNLFPWSLPVMGMTEPHLTITLSIVTSPFFTMNLVILVLLLLIGTPLFLRREV